MLKITYLFTSRSYIEENGIIHLHRYTNIIFNPINWLIGIFCDAGITIILCLAVHVTYSYGSESRAFQYARMN
jgi:hypothetical protein